MIVESEPGRGTTVTSRCRSPRRPPPPPRGPVGGTGSTGSQAATWKAEQSRVLVVDDDPPCCAPSKRILGAGV